MKKLPITERRFREGSGQRFMLDGETVRCQCRSNNKLKKLCPPEYATTDEDYRAWRKTLGPDDFWPQAQCGWKAEPHTFMCEAHGGKSRTAKKQDILDFLPGEMAAKIEALKQNPVILNRSFEIYTLLARNLTLHERMKYMTEIPAMEIWKGLEQVRRGNIVEGCRLIETALRDADSERVYWEEIRANTTLLQGLTRTQVTTAKDLQQIVTMEQFMATLMMIADEVTESVSKHISDERSRDLIIGDVERRVGGLINARTTGILTAPAQEDRGE